MFKTVFVENYGCISNRFDLEIMLAYLEKEGIRVVDCVDFADFILVNSCAVKKSTEDRVLGRLRLLGGLNKPVIVAGCLPKIDFSAVVKSVPNYSAVLDPFSVDKIVRVLRDIEVGKVNGSYISDATCCKIEMPKVRLCEALDIVQICEGCVGSCAFCCTRFARGRLYSYPVKMVVDRVREIVGCGVKEIWITAQDTGCYGLDSGSSLAELLGLICDVEGEFFLRVGMMNPSHVLPMLDELIDVYKDEKIFKFLHLPLQSGNDEVLRSMNRSYRVRDFSEIVDSFRKAIPDITISTDMICGFPTETDDAFQDSLRVIEQVEPEVVNVSRFYPRPRTPAWKMKLLPSGTVKARGLAMTRLCRSIARRKNEKLLNWTGSILIEERGKKLSSVGRNFAYKPIVLKGEEELGKILTVTVKKAFTTYLEGIKVRD